MIKEELIEKIQAVAEAPSCYAGLKKVIEEYLAAVGKADEKTKAETLIKALEECVTGLDDLIIFLKSDNGKKALGDMAPSMLKAAEEAKAKGETICICPACQNGAAVLKNKAVLLG
jgi:hypothetical protein